MILKLFDIETYKPKSKKTVKIKRSKVGKVFSEPIPKMELKPVENMSDIRDDNKSIMQSSLKQETTTISSCFSCG